MFDRIAKIVAAVIEALNVPIKVALVFLNILVLMCWLFTIGTYGYYSILGLILSEIPITYYVAREAARQMRLKPKQEGFDFDSAHMEKALQEYVKMIEEKRKKTTEP